MTTDPNAHKRMARIWHTRSASDLMASWLTAIATAPKLIDAGCRGSTDFDVDHDCDGEPPEAREDRLRRAVAACNACPALDACTAWFDGLSPRQRPTGVVAGRVVERPGASPITLAERATRPRIASQTQAWLAKYLSEHGPTGPKDVLAAAEAAGLQRRSVRLAAGVLGVTRPGGRSMRWDLPRPVQPDGATGIATQPEGEQHAG
ncbi:hypothetical protein MHPYR_410002 [uncultured Mycobacterium sp.]|uniref:4Fe-4S Wbl-type domain-containing protein n=1 Tax=uncultured Mycobacterium sp. TaxID=171292 RepID=A0A1Y5PF45_9MYCO|nr:hypothetical protein MHPYR_410002 [uncultured Mycobacterium sp.]